MSLNFTPELAHHHFFPAVKDKANHEAGKIQGGGRQTRARGRWRQRQSAAGLRPGRPALPDAGRGRGGVLRSEPRPLGGAQACLKPWFRTSGLQNCERVTCVVLSLPVYGTWLWQP